MENKYSERERERQPERWHNSKILMQMLDTFESDARNIAHFNVFNTPCSHMFCVQIMCTFSVVSCYRCGSRRKMRTKPI